MTIRMKQSPLLCHIPIVALTAKSTEQDRLEGIKSGVVSYLCKPFSPEELLMRIEQLLKDRELLKKFYMQKLMLDRKPEVSPCSQRCSVRWNQTKSGFFRSRLGRKNVHESIPAQQKAHECRRLLHHRLHTADQDKIGLQTPCR